MAMQLKALKLLDSARLTRLCTPTAITIVSARFVSLFYYFILRVHSCLATSQKLKQKNKTAREREREGEKERKREREEKSRQCEECGLYLPVSRFFEPELNSSW